MTSVHGNAMEDDLIGLVPAAGRGARLGLPYPKELYPLIRNNRYRPISQFVVDNLTAAGLQHIVFVVNETKHQLMGYFGSGERFRCRISYVYQEAADSDLASTSPGLAHALDAAYHLTRGKTVCFGMADTLMRPTGVFTELREAAAPDDDVVLALFATSRPDKSGMVDVQAGGRVTRVVDKPLTTTLTHMWGCIVWRPSFTEHLHECVHGQGRDDFAGVLNSAIDRGLKVRGVPMVNGTYVDLGTYEEIGALDRQYREGYDLGDGGPDSGS